ncbi:MAG: polymer-forming cytoskeletal protein [Polyangiaceae bacterium]|nr:polymer-forming cytoskeletal protein [Polyangiaceae bacterium]
MVVASLTVIGADTVIRGDVQSSHALEILGRIEGNISSEGEVTVAQAGSVLGTVSGSRVVVAGSVEGNLKGTELVAIESEGRVVGDLMAPSVSVAVGAWVKGEVRTAGESSLAVRRGTRARGISPESNVASAVAPIEVRSRSLLQSGDVADQEVVTPRRPTPIAPAAFRPEDDSEDDEGPITPRPEPSRRRPPPPQLPTLGKGVKAKKKGKK